MAIFEGFEEKVPAEAAKKKAENQLTEILKRLITQTAKDPATQKVLQQILKEGVPSLSKSATNVIGKALAHATKGGKKRTPKEKAKRNAEASDFAAHQEPPPAKEKASHLSQIAGGLLTAAKVAAAPLAAYIALEGAGAAGYIAMCAVILRGVAAWYTGGSSEAALPVVSTTLINIADGIVEKLPAPVKDSKVYQVPRALMGADASTIRKIVGPLVKMIKGGDFFEGNGPTNEELGSFGKYLQRAKVTPEAEQALKTASENFKTKVSALAAKQGLATAATAAALTA